MSIRDEHHQGHRETGVFPGSAAGSGTDDKPTTGVGTVPRRSPGSGPELVSLSRYRARRVQARAGDGEHGADGSPPYPLTLDALRAVMRDEIGELRRELTAQLDAADDVLTMDGAAQLLRVSTKTILSWHRTRKLPGRKIGAEWRFRRSELLRWIGENNVL